MQEDVEFQGEGGRGGGEDGRGEESSREVEGLRGGRRPVNSFISAEETG